MGKNALECKNGIDLSSRVNQQYVQLPFRLFLDMLRSKCAEYGIEVIETEESHTSKTSCYGKDGQRVKRGLFLDKALNKVFNADLNSALNILKRGLGLFETFREDFLKALG